VREAPDKAKVLTRAVVRAAGLLGLTQATVGRTLGISASTASRMFSGHYLLEPDRKEWELASLFVRIFRSLSSLTGGSDEHARAWMTGKSLSLGARPIDLILTAEGLVRVAQYLDASRGRY
jgi:uncharacterized protein (DUF2384 family)